MFVCFLSVISMEVKAQEYHSMMTDDSSRFCGDNVTWDFDPVSGNLTISGEGRMTELTSFTSAPWYDKRFLIKNVIISHGVTSISSFAFNWLENMETVNIPSSVTSIGSAAFSGCQKLQSVNIPDKVTRIEMQAFRNCTSLTSVRIPSSVTSINGNPFDECTGLTSIEVDPSNSIFEIVDGGLVNKETKTLIAFPAGKVGSYSVPKSVTVIGISAFSGCRNLSSVIFSDGVVEIKTTAFSQCQRLISVNLPDSITTIGIRAFYGCSSLKTIRIPEEVTVISNSTFSGCYGLSSVILPPHLKTIGNDAFSFCHSLMSVRIPDSVTYIGEEAFYLCSQLNDVVIPSGVTYFGASAFLGCYSLESVIFLGSSDPGDSTILTNCNLVKFICVPPEYSSLSFCGKNISCKSSLCETIQKEQNQCFSIVTQDYTCFLRKNSIVREWENQSNGCIMYQCQNETGVLSKTAICSSKDDSRLACVNDKCIAEDDGIDNGWVVVITINTTESNSITSEQIAVEVSNLSGIDVDEFTIGVEYDDEGRIITILVYVNDKTTADTISVSVNELDKTETCEGILCRSEKTSIREITRELSLSNAQGLCFNMIIIILLALFPVYERLSK